VNPGDPALSVGRQPLGTGRPGLLQANRSEDVKHLRRVERFGDHIETAEIENLRPKTRVRDP